MEVATKNYYCAFQVPLEGPNDEGETSIKSMQEAFEKFRRRRQEEYRRRAGKEESLQRGLHQPEARWQLRMKFLEQAKSYIGVPYAKKYHKPGTPEFESPLFLDCCGLIRRVSQDLTEELGFYMGPGNQAYQYDTLPITLPSQEHLKPGDLIFISGIYFDPQRMRQPHDIVHVEIWLGEGERSLGARWKTGRVQVFDSYKFVSKTYGSIEYHFKSIETWLQGICHRSSWQSKAEREELPRSPGEFLELSHEFNQEVKTLESLGKSQSLSPTYLTSHCLDHKWALTRQVPGRKSIFSPWTKESGPAKEDADAPRSTSESQLGNEKMVPKVPSMVDYARDASPSASQQMEALDLQGFSRAGSRVSGANNLSTDQMTEGSTFLETRGWSVEGHSPSLEGKLDQERGSKEEGPSEPEPMAPCPEASEGAAPSRPARDFVNMARKSCSTSKVNPKGILVGGRRNKKGRAGTQRGHQHSGGPPSADAGWITEKSLESRGNAATLHLGFQRNPSYCRAGISSSSKEEPTNETQSKGHKPSARMNPEEKKPEEPRLGPFFYIGGANGADIVKAYCRKKGWQRIYDNHREDYLLKWCETKCRDTYYKFSEGEQLLYQIPNNRLLTTKIGLLVNLREYERVTKKISRNAKSLRMEDFFPESLRLDTREDRELFFDIYREPHIWICKPTGSNQGRGIFLLKNREDVKKLQQELQAMEEDKKPQYKPHQARVVQRYIDKPLLLEGKKFDVRSYLLVACTDPYMVFFGHGYARLTCLDYNPMSDDMTSHLTNQYMQKKNPLYNHVKEETVWQMDRFNTYVNERFRHANGLPKDWVFNYFTKRMKDIMLQCFRAVKSKLDSKLGYFDLIGCDFLIDEDFKVWLLEMNANPALHTNCSALRNIIPTVVNETLDLVIEIFTKSQKGQAILPLESLCHFALLHNGVTSDNRPPRPTKSRTSLRSLRSFWTQMESGTGTGGAPNPDSSTGGTRVADRHPPKPLEKPFKVELPAPPDGISLLPNKTVPRSTLPMPQIQLSNVPDLSSCSSAKAILRGSQVCSSGNQYIIKHIPESDRHPAGSSKANSGDEKAKSNSVAPLGAPSKDRSYTAWFHQTFGSRFPLATSNLATIPMTSSQMISFHLQANMPPSVPLLHENAKLPRQLMTHAKPSTDNGKPAAVA